MPNPDKHGGVSYWDILLEQACDLPDEENSGISPEAKLHAYKAISRSISGTVCHIMVNHTIVDFLPGYQCRMVERPERAGFFLDLSS